MTQALALPTIFMDSHPGDAAAVLEQLPRAALTAELEGVEAAVLVPVLDYLSPHQAAAAFMSIDPERRDRVLMRASPRLAVVILGQLTPAERDEALAPLSETVRAEIERQLDFPENTAGRLMDATFSTYTPEMTVDEALGQLRASPVRRARSLYLVDAENRLSGRVDMQDVALAGVDEALGALAHPVDASVTVTAQRSEIVGLLDRHRLDSVPVVDLEGRLVGVVRYGSLFQAIEDVATAGLQRMVGSADERALSTPVFSVRKRLPWLHINLLTAFLAAAVVGLFEDLIAQFTALAVLLPVVAGQSGNAGSQALAVTIRGLALREIGPLEWRGVLSKEVQVGVVNGVVLAFTCGLGVYLWSASLGLALVIAVAMVLSMIAAGISGAVVPLVLTRLGQDPATASSIILTTVTDVAGFFSFLGTATALSFML